jgi:Flp pilus assembly protein TadB
MPTVTACVPERKLERNSIIYINRTHFLEIVLVIVIVIVIVLVIVLVIVIVIVLVIVIVIVIKHYTLKKRSISKKKYKLKFLSCMVKIYTMSMKNLCLQKNWKMLIKYPIVEKQ